MAKLVSQITLGIDVGKDELVIADWGSGHVCTLANEPDHIRAWLASLAGPVRMALEPTSHYHVSMADLAEAAGHTVYRSILGKLRTTAKRSLFGIRATQWMPNCWPGTLLMKGIP